MERHAAPRELAQRPRAQARRGPGQDLADVRREGEPRGHAAGAQARVEGQGQLDPRGAAAHHDEVDRAAAREAREAPLELIHEAADRPRGERVLARARELEAAHPRADVEARDVVTERRTTRAVDAAGLGVDARRRREDHARPGAPRERDDVDLALFGGVVAGHEARHHARVEGLGPIEDDRHAQVGHGPHREPADHLDVRVAAAHEHQLAQRTRPVARCGLHPPSRNISMREPARAAASSLRSSE